VRDFYLGHRLSSICRSSSNRSIGWMSTSN
jgi:hypothetical protein